MWRFALVIAVLVGPLAAFACEPWPTVQWENSTSQRVRVNAYGDSDFDLQPHQIRKITNSASHWRPEIRVVAEDGRVLLEDHITWDELKKMKYKIVITDPAHLPSPTLTPAATPTG